MIPFGVTGTFESDSPLLLPTRQPFYASLKMMDRLTNYLINIQNGRFHEAALIQLDIEGEEFQEEWVKTEPKEKWKEKSTKSKEEKTWTPSSYLDPKSES